MSDPVGHQGASQSPRALAGSQTTPSVSSSPARATAATKASPRKGGDKPSVATSDAVAEEPSLGEPSVPLGEPSPLKARRRRVSGGSGDAASTGSPVASALVGDLASLQFAQGYPFLKTRRTPNAAKMAPAGMPPGAMELLPGELYFYPQLPRAQLPKQAQGISVINTDQALAYVPFATDFGPLNLSCTYRYVKLLEEKIDNKRACVLHITGQDPRQAANAAVLLLSYLVFSRHMTAGEAFRPMEKLRGSALDLRSPAALFGRLVLPPYRDALQGQCDHKHTVEDCAYGMEHARNLGWMQDYDLKLYDWMEKVENGDMSWLFPNKFLAFAGPHRNRVDDEGYECMTPEDLIAPFRSLGVTLVVRLNKAQYDKASFTKAGIKHLDLYFPDGTVPPQHLIDRFLLVCEREEGAIAVHCKAGLGRTGTLIGIYCMKHFGWTARAFIAWSRMCRPGCILGPQQEFLCAVEDGVRRSGARLRRDHRIPEAPVSPRLRPADKTVLSEHRRKEAETREDVGQAEFLRGARRGK